MPRVAAPETAREDVPRDTKDNGSGGDQHHLHVGSSLPEESAGRHGRKLGAQEMSREETKKLLGGYATGTLTPEEQQALFAAALEDQELFDALANEQSLRDLMRDLAARAQMLAALDGPASRGGWMGWMRRPWVAGLVTAGLAAVGVTVWRTQGGGIVVQREAPPMAAQVKPEPTPPAVDAVSPASKVEERQIIASAKPDNRRRESAAATAPVAPLTPPPATSAPTAGS